MAKETIWSTKPKVYITQCLKCGHWIELNLSTLPKTENALSLGCYSCNNEFVKNYKDLPTYVQKLFKIKVEESANNSELKFRPKGI